jgi:hypothetical protein
VALLGANPTVMLAPQGQDAAMYATNQAVK